MKLTQKEVMHRVVILISAIMIALGFASFGVAVEDYAREDCFDNIEETASQISEMFLHSNTQSYDQLELFADILAANGLDDPELLQAYMETFCQTRAFCAVCIHLEDGTTYSYGEHPHEQVNTAPFAQEAANPTFLSQVYALGALRSQRFVYQSAPILRDGRAIAVLYGFISLDTFPALISSTTYEGNCQFYIVDGDSGDFLMDEYHRFGSDGQELPLGNLFDGSMGSRETKPGYQIEDMRAGVAGGNSGYYIFKSQRTGQWYYTYYMPIGIQNWSVQLTIDEPTAFAGYIRTRNTVFCLILCEIAFALVIMLTMFLQNRRRRKADQASLHQADYRNAVRGALITAHNNPGFVDRALQIVAEKTGAETAMLLSVQDNRITGGHYWPSKGKDHAAMLIGRSIRDDFPLLYDAILVGKCFDYDRRSSQEEITSDVRQMMDRFGIGRIVLVPILDTTGVLKASLSVVNPSGSNAPEVLESVTYDFFMAITNLESHNIIKQMGMVDYLTGVQNRNSFEAAASAYETACAEKLWCVFVDVNGLHSLNNTQGHKAGDIMLQTVAGTMKKIFGFENVYRLGGDEFLAVKRNSTHEELMACKYRLLADLKRRGYFVSVGFAGMEKNENGVFDIERIMTEAEKIMYREKRDFYAENELSDDRGQFPELSE